MFDKLNDFTKKISDLEDKPSLNPIELKAYFDNSPEELRVALNHLIDQLASIESGKSGADNIGVTPIGSSPSTLQGLLVWLKSQIDSVSLGQIPDNAITSAKLAASAKQASNITVADASNLFAAADLEGVLKELFTNANNGKTNLAGVIGSPASATGSFDDLKTVVQNVKNKLAANLTAKGTSAIGTESLDSLAAKINSVSTGRKSATGVAAGVNNGGNFRITVNNLTFKPRVIYAVLYTNNPLANNNFYNSAMIDTSVFPLGSGIQYVALGNQRLIYTSGQEIRADGFTMPVADDGNYSWIACE
ncbi:hypothetical protein LRR81_08675 [Metabacillus sp. GX 13764]|uniref:hypothetical protein n=1 Tax=Metabacillus kandeliae TaxID=2900151 RepID=UPI001E50593F|nr:hypothetical protein [Metabacillus kandeliae]MCD7034307.1 hypothetical protein [Metabacillus kandeliae]